MQGFLSHIYYYPEDALSPKLLRGWRAYRDFLLEDIRHIQTDKNFGRKMSGENLLIYSSTVYIKEIMLSGRKSKSNVGGSRQQSNQPFPLKWINVQLTDEDNSAIGGETASLELALSAFIGMVNERVGCSLKYQPERAEWCASIYQPGTADNPYTIGVSGFSTDVRLALLVVVYKFEYRLGGSFDNAAREDTSRQQFR